jgi:flavin reductase (DIM6/NTAB) family NADH-FMN oxidoreductase RutF
MKTYNIDELSNKQRYKLLTGLIVPRPIALITTLSQNNVVNVAPFSYFNIISSTPPTIVVGINRIKGEIKDTAKNIIKRKKFNIHMIDKQILEDANLTSMNLPYDESEIALTQFTLNWDTSNKVPALEQAAVYMEVEYIKHIELENEGSATTDVIFGEIQRLSVRDNIVDEHEYIDYNAYDIVGRLAGTKYATLGDIVSLDRPK